MSESFEDKLLRIKAMKNGVGLQNMVNEASDIIGNPIVLFDLTYRLLANTENVVTDDPIWNEFVTLKTFSHETIDFFNNEKFIEVFADSDVVSTLISDKLKYVRKNGKLFAPDNNQIGDIAVIGCNRLFTEGDDELIEMLCELLSVEMCNSNDFQKVKKIYEETPIIHMIQNKPGSYKAVKKLYDRVKPNLYIAAVDITAYEPTLTHLTYMTNKFYKLRPDYEYGIYNMNIVILMDTDKPVFEYESEMGELYDFFIKYKIYAGISEGFQDLRELGKRYAEAMSALNYGLKSMRKANVFYYDSFKFERFIHKMSDTTDIDILQNPVVELIQRYDSAHSSELLKTLYFYIMYVKDTEKTCKALGFGLRETEENLRILQNEFKIDLSDGDMLFSIYMAIKIFNVIGE